VYRLLNQDCVFIVDCLHESNATYRLSVGTNHYLSRLLCLGIVLALVLTTSAVFAQSTISGEITGVVTRGKAVGTREKNLHLPAL
jgi:hypothetical protein